MPGDLCRTTNHLLYYVDDDAGFTRVPGFTRPTRLRRHTTGWAAFHPTPSYEPCEFLLYHGGGFPFSPPPAVSSERGPASLTASMLRDCRFL